MLELHGKGFVIDHCLVQFQREQEEKSYKQYIADNIRMIGENIARGLGGAYYASRWGVVEPQDDRTGDEIALEVIKRAGLSLKGGE